MIKAKLTVPCNKLFHQFKLKDRTIILCAKYNPVESKIQIGMSICNPLDGFDEKLGRRIAEERAVHKRKIHLYSLYTGNRYNGKDYVNSDINKNYGLFLCLLKEQEELIKLDPHKYIPSIKKE